LKKIIFLGLFSMASHLMANSLQVGDGYPMIQLKDQHEQAVLMNEQVQLILFAAGKSSSELMTKTLEALPPTTLKDKKALYIADISGMPGFITKMVAIPRMQKMPYSIGLIRDEALSQAFPKKESAITIIRWQAGKVTQIRFVTTQAEIAQELQ
jgi:hypothetical protein